MIDNLNTLGALGPDTAANEEIVSRISRAIEPAGDSQSERERDDQRIERAARRRDTNSERSSDRRTNGERQRDLEAGTRTNLDLDDDDERDDRNAERQRQRDRSPDEEHTPESRTRATDIEVEDDYGLPSDWNLADVAEELGVPIKKLYDLRIATTGPDGSGTTVKLGELKDKHAVLQSAERHHAQATQTTQRLEHQIVQADELAYQLQGRAIESQALIDSLTAHHNQDISATDWQTLHDTDPGLWAAKRAEADNRARGLDEMRAHATQQWDHAQAAQHQVMQAARADELARGYAHLLEVIPQWNGSQGVGRQVVSHMLDTFNFSPQEINAITDPRIYILAAKSMEYDRIRAKGTRAAKKMLNLPAHILKPGARRAKSGASDEDSKLSAALRRSGHVDDAAALISHRRKR